MAIFLLGNGQLSLAQQVTLKVEFLSSINKNDISILNYQTAFEDSLALFSELTQFILDIREKGYLLANADSGNWIGNQYIAYVSIGNKYNWQKLDRGNVSGETFSRIGYKNKFFEGNAVSIDDLEQLQYALVRKAENQGYPFASVKLDSFRAIHNNLSASLHFDPGSQVFFDSLIVIGEAKIKKSFLSSFLKLNQKRLFGSDRLKPQRFSQSSVDGAVEKLNSCPYLELSSAPVLIFDNQKAFLKLYLEEKKVSQVDGVIGLLPNTEADNSLRLTGQFLMSLYNPFGTGKKIFARWQRVKQASPIYELEYVHPNLFRTSLDVFFKLSSLKEDSTFTSLSWSGGMGYSIGNRGAFSFFYESASSNVLSNNSFEQTNILLPERTRTTINSYGIKYFHSSLDDLFFPKNGFLLDFQVKLGSKKFTPNPELSDSIYSDLQFTSNQLGMEMDVKKYFSLGKYFSILFRNQTGRIWNNQLFVNDLFRLGGLTTLRGFAENQFFSSSFTVNTLEIQAHFARESMFVVFADHGILASNVNSSSMINYPLGIGAGMVFSTKSGIFTLLYSLGQEGKSSISLSNSKIHFGLTNRF